MKLWRIVALSFAMVLLMSSSCFAAETAGDFQKTTSTSYQIKPLKDEPIDYNEENNWLLFDKNPTKEVDLFYIYPTANIKSSEGKKTADITDAHIAAAMSQYNSQGSAFASYTNVYVPLYRQAGMDTALTYTETSEFVDFLQSDIPRTDIYGALDYYFTYANNGRPFILAAHSQGSSMMSIVLKEYMRVHPEYLKNMVACYAIGFPFDKEWIDANPHLKYAEGETDTGCIISWNTEGPGATADSMCIAKKDGYTINPLSWKTDETYVGTGLNKGALVNGKIIPHYADAQIDAERGALICTTDKNYLPKEVESFFGDKCLHLYDYGLYYENIKENGLKRINAFLNK